MVWQTHYCLWPEGWRSKKHDIKYQLERVHDNKLKWVLSCYVVLCTLCTLSCHLLFLNGTFLYSENNFLLNTEVILEIRCKVHHFVWGWSCFILLLLQEKSWLHTNSMRFILKLIGNIGKIHQDYMLVNLSNSSMWVIFSILYSPPM